MYIHIWNVFIEYKRRTSPDELNFDVRITCSRERGNVALSSIVYRRVRTKLCDIQISNLHVDVTTLLL